MATELRRRLGALPQLRDLPSVSIVVLSRDGADQLRTLLSGLVHRTDYQPFELVLVDNGSSDDSLAMLREADTPFPVSTIENRDNATFSDGCNQGAAVASGELLLFLNNDIEPFEAGWLHELVACFERSRAGLVGATLLQRDDTRRFSHGLSVQQRGTLIEDDAGVLRSAYRDQGVDPLGEGLGVDVESVAVSGACCMIARETFDAIGGFTPGYRYGGEDTDLALKVRAAGDRVLCSGRAFAIHPAGVTLGTVAAETRRAWTAVNRRLLTERWGPRAWREYELDRLTGGGVWTTPSDSPHDGATLDAALAVSFCLMAEGDWATGPLGGIVDGLRAELVSRRHRCLSLAGPGVDEPESLTYDVVVHAGADAPHVVNPSQFNVLWSTGGPEGASVEACGCDMVFAAAPEPHGVDTLAERLIDATLSRMAEIEFPTRIPSEYTTKPRR